MKMSIVTPNQLPSPGGFSTEHLQVNITTSNLSAPFTSEMWVDKNGTVQRFILNGFEYGAAQADPIGQGLISSMLIALAGADNPTVQSTISAQLKNPTALVQKVQNRMFESIQYQTTSLRNLRQAGYWHKLVTYLIPSLSLRHPN
jgi:hypothetical protein